MGWMAPLRHLGAKMPIGQKPPGPRHHIWTGSNDQASRFRYADVMEKPISRPAAGHKCDWKAAYRRDELIARRASVGGVPQPARPFVARRSDLPGRGNTSGKLQ